MSQIPVCSGHLPQPSVPSTLPMSPDDLGKGTFSDNRVIGSLPPLYRQVLGSSWLTPTTSTAEPEPSANLRPQAESRHYMKTMAKISPGNFLPLGECHEYAGTQHIYGTYSSEKEAQKNVKNDKMSFFFLRERRHE